MPDVPVDPAGYQFRCLFKGIQSCVGTAAGDARFTQERNSLPQKRQRKHQQYPGEYLPHGEGIGEPMRDIDQDQEQNGFPCEEPVESVRMHINDRSSRDQQQTD